MTFTGQASMGPWRSELLAGVRAISGGLLFGVPLLYTMEVWWIGSHTTPTQMAFLLALLVLPVFVLNQTDGFRASRDVRPLDAAADTVEAVAIGIVVTAGVLVLLRELTGSTPVEVGMGKVLYEAVPFCLGVSVQVVNNGGETAANVQVTAVLTVDGEATTSDQTIDFLAGSEEADLVFVFTDDPAQGELSVVAGGFERP